MKLNSAETTCTWPEKQDVSSSGVWPGQDGEEAQVQHVSDGGRLQVLEHFGPGLSARVIIEQQLQGAVIVKLPGPQEAEEESIVQSGPEIGMFLRGGRKQKNLCLKKMSTCIQESSAHF